MKSISDKLLENYFNSGGLAIPQKHWLRNKPIAHKGLWTPDNPSNIPENSLPAVENAIRHKYAVEVDIQLSLDGELVVFHDLFLNKLCGIGGTISQYTLKQLKEFKLSETEYTIPTLEEVLELTSKKTPVLVDIKGDVMGKQGTAKLLAHELKNYKGHAAMHSFNFSDLNYFKRVAPNILRGQIISDFNKQDVSFILKLLLRGAANLFEAKGDPHFISLDVRSKVQRIIKSVWANKRGGVILAWLVDTKTMEAVSRGFADNIIFERINPKQPW